MSNSHQITTHLRSRIASGALRHSSVIEIAAAVSFYAVSRNTVVSAFKAMTETGYLQINSKGGFSVFSWHEQEIEDQFRVGKAMLDIALETISERCSERQRTGLRHRISQIQSDTGQEGRDGDGLAYNITHALSALTFLSPTTRLHQAFMSFLPVGTRRIAVAGMPQSELNEMLDLLMIIAQSLYEGDASSSKGAMASICERMRSSILARARQLEKYPAPLKVDFLDLEDVVVFEDLNVPILPDNVQLDEWLISDFAITTKATHTG